MKPYLFLSVIYFLFESHAAFSQSPENYAPNMVDYTFEEGDPSVPFSSKLMTKLAGSVAARKANGRLNCPLLVTKEWAYPDALTIPFCYDAQTSCFRYMNMKQQIKNNSKRRST